jgi:hypothetical protein
MTLVIDSGLVVAALVDSGGIGTWADHLLATNDLAAPHLMPVEVTNVWRRAAMVGEISADTAALAHADLLSLKVELFAYEPYWTRNSLRWTSGWRRHRDHVVPSRPRRLPDAHPACPKPLAPRGPIRAGRCERYQTG